MNHNKKNLKYLHKTNNTAQNVV